MRSARYFAMHFRVVAMLLALASHPLAAFATSPMLPGLWELRITTTVARQTEPEAVVRECLSQQDIDHPTKTLPRPDADCALSNLETRGNRTTYDMTCKRDEYTHRGRMELVVGSANYDGIADLKITAAGKRDTPMTVVVNARRVGDCQK